MLVGVPHGQMPTLPMHMLFGGKVYRGAPGGCSTPDRDFPLLVRWFKEGKMPLDLMVTRHYKLEQINEACDALGPRRDRRAAPSSISNRRVAPGTLLTAALKAAGCSWLETWPASGMTTRRAPGMAAASWRAVSERDDGVLLAVDDQRGHADTAQLGGEIRVAERDGR